MSAHRKSRTRRARPSRLTRRTLRSRRSFNGGARKKSKSKAAASVAASNHSNNENVSASASASAAASNHSNNGNAPTELEPSDEQNMRRLERLIPPMLEGNAAIAEEQRRAALTVQQRNREDMKALNRLHMGIGVFSAEIMSTHSEIEEIMAEGERYAKYIPYKILFVRRGIALLERLANSFYRICNNNPDADFREESAYLKEVLDEHMEEIAPIKAALRNH